MKGGDPVQYKKQEIFDALEAYIDDCCARRGAAPSMTEIAAALGIAQSTVSKYLKVMREQGRVRYAGHSGVSTPRAVPDAAGVCLVPVLGAVACGVPKLAEENIEEYVRLPVSLFGRGDFFLLRAKGSSMIDAGIDDGDFVLVRQQETAYYNQIAVARIGDEATLKRYRPQPDGTVRLHPENRDMEDIVADAADCIIQGVAVKVFKDVR